MKISNELTGLFEKQKTLFLFFIFAISAAQIALGNSAVSPQISWFKLVIGLFGGLAFFLYGMENMSEGLRKTAGSKMRSILAALTNNRIIGLLVGAFVTTVIQSSSATTVMLVSFVQADLMTFAQSLGVILGADIGTTITAQLIAFKLTDYAILLVAVGFGLRMFSTTDSFKNIGQVILGFGILFYGMKLMSDAMSPLRTWPDFIDVMKGLENPFWGLLIGTLFTALIQSSSAFTGIVIVLAQQGLLTLEAGIPLVFGANIGTCITAGLASIGTSREAKRVAMAHVGFKIAGVALFIFWIPTFAGFIQSIADQFGSDTARQIANAHTIFNVSLALVFLPFTAIFAGLLLRLYPQEKIIRGLVPVTWHLDEKMIVTPGFAIDLARTEISRMAKILGRMVRSSVISFIPDPELINRETHWDALDKIKTKKLPDSDMIYPQLTIREGILMRERKINFLNEKIVDYLIRVSRLELSDIQANEVYSMISIANDMESIGDIIHRNMLPLFDKKQKLKADFSTAGKEELMVYHIKVCKQISRLEKAFSKADLETADKIMTKEEKYQSLASMYRQRHLKRLNRNFKESIETHEIHMELMDFLKQINVYTANIAKTYFVAMSRESEGKE